MSLLWTYLWPTFAAGLIIGPIAGTMAFRRKRTAALAVGAVLTLAAAALWHGPMGAAERYSSKVESVSREVLDHYEMTQVTARLGRGPLSRQLILSGPADDFQRSELVRVMSDVPGVSSARWSSTRTIPLLAEGTLAAILGFLVGLLLAYLVELRRRHNAQWKW